MPDPRPYSLMLSASRSLLNLAKTGVTELYQSTLGRPLARAARNVVSERNQGYKIRLNDIDTLKPLRCEEPSEVAVIGGGLAGLTSAWVLAKRGHSVTVYERESYLGGMVGAWKKTTEQGEVLDVEHGFHAFFGSYYNLNRILTELDLDKHFVKTDDYRILTRDGGSLGFSGLEPAPFLNLFDMVRKGVFPLAGILLNPSMRELDPVLRYDPVTTYRDHDNTSYAEFADRAKLPKEMRLMFNTVARAFFARGDQMSFAELIKSFHLFYLSNDHGLMFRYATEGYETCLLNPFAAALKEAGVTIRRNKTVDAITRQKNGRLRVAGKPYDHVIVATDVRGAHSLLAESALAQEAPGLVENLSHIQPQNRYANLRVWLDRDLRRDLPIFTVTEKIRALDSITTCHRAQGSQRDWVMKHGGAVIELHAYQVPPELKTDKQIRQALLADLDDYLPELRGAKIVHEDLQVKDDFTAFFTGMHAHRPGTLSGIDGVSFAGDWVRLPCPAMLMEGAVTSGLFAANAILTQDGLRQEPVYSVPLRSMMALDT